MRCISKSTPMLLAPLSRPRRLAHEAGRPGAAVTVVLQQVRQQAMDGGVFPGQISLRFVEVVFKRADRLGQDTNLMLGAFKLMLVPQ